MSDVILVELNRVLNKRVLIAFCGVVLLLCMWGVGSTLSYYNIYDNVGNLEVSAINNIRESKSEEHTIMLDQSNMIKIINREDRSNYLYNMNLVYLLLEVFENKKFEDITEIDVANFYDIRIKNFRNTKVNFLDIDKQKYVIEKISEMREPIEVGYSLGWLTINSNMVDLVTFVMIFISFYVLNIFGESQKGSMRNLVIATKRGRRDLIKSKLIVGGCISLIIYFGSVAIFTVCNFVVFGLRGYNLCIQSSFGYLYSAYNITFVEQYIMNVILGCIAVLTMTHLSILISVVFRKVLNAGIVTVFVWILMYALPNNIYSGYKFSHCLTNFLPYNVVNFNNYYLYNDVYRVGNDFVFNYYVVSVVLVIVNFVFGRLAYWICCKEK